MLQNASSKCNCCFFVVKRNNVTYKFQSHSVLLESVLDITHSLSVRNSSEHTAMVGKSTQLPK